MGRSQEAVICEAFFDEVLRQVGHHKVELSMSFIGIANSMPGGRYKASCVHGAAECKGNIHQLCVMNQYAEAKPEPFATITTPPDAQSTWWAFTQCLNRTPALIGEEIRARDCAEEVGIDWDAPGGVGECANSEEGEALLGWNVFLRRMKKSYDYILTDWKGENERYVDSCLISVGDIGRCVYLPNLKQCFGSHREVSDFVQLIESIYQQINGQVPGCMTRN